MERNLSKQQKYAGYLEFCQSLFNPLQTESPEKVANIIKAASAKFTSTNQLELLGVLIYENFFTIPLQKLVDLVHKIQHISINGNTEEFHIIFGRFLFPLIHKYMQETQHGTMTEAEKFEGPCYFKFIGLLYNVEMYKSQIYEIAKILLQQSSSNHLPCLNILLGTVGSDPDFNKLVNNSFIYKPNDDDDSEDSEEEVIYIDTRPSHLRTTDRCAPIKFSELVPREVMEARKAKAAKIAALKGNKEPMKAHPQAKVLLKSFLAPESLPVAKGPSKSLPEANKGPLKSLPEANKVASKSHPKVSKVSTTSLTEANICSLNSLSEVKFPSKSFLGPKVSLKSLRAPKVSSVTSRSK